MPSVNELLLDAVTDHAVDLSQYSRFVIRRMLTLLNRVDADLADALSRALDRLPAESFTVERLESLLGAVRRLNAQAYKAVERELIGVLKEFAQVESAFQFELLRGVVPSPVQVHFRIARVSVEQVRAAALSRPFQGRLLRDWAAKLAEDRMVYMRNAVRLGFVEGQTVSQIVTRVRGTRANNYADGVINRSRRDLEAVVDTAVKHTAAVARDELLAKNEDIVKAINWTSVLDSKTSSWCAIRDGLKYTVKGHKPIGHNVPYLAGPGKIHWRAVAAGSLVSTAQGLVPIERVRSGDLVLTHTGRFAPVVANKSKRFKEGVLRVVHTDSGRTLRATDDHPVAVPTEWGWKFVGALELGDCLLGDPQQLAVVPGVEPVVSTHPEDRPSLRDEIGVALARTIKLVASNIDFEGKTNIGPCEIDDVAVELVLRNPAVIEAESSKHHLLALAQTLEKLGSYRLRDLLAYMMRDGASEAGIPHSGDNIWALLGGSNAFQNAGLVDGIVVSHAPGVRSHDRIGFLGEPPGPMFLLSEDLSAAGVNVGVSLLGSRPGTDAMRDGIFGQSPIRKSFPALDGSQGESVANVSIADQCRIFSEMFRHERIVALEVQHFNGFVHDLEVEGDESYVCCGIVVSNCRAAGVPVLKSWKELGIDAAELPASTRASMDGQVPADMSFAQWLSKQSAYRQEQVLGPVRARLMRQGGMQLPDFYSPGGEYLSIKQLRERNAAAFERAGV